MMSEIEQALEQLAKLNPRDQRDAEFYMSEETRLKLAEMCGVPDLAAPLSDRLFGIPVRIDDSLPPATVEMRAETELDRALRRAAREGRTVNIMKPLFPETYPDPVPVPTLRALLKHWLRKIKR